MTASPMLERMTWRLSTSLSRNCSRRVGFGVLWESLESIPCHPVLGCSPERVLEPVGSDALGRVSRKGPWEEVVEDLIRGSCGRTGWPGVGVTLARGAPGGLPGASWSRCEPG